MTSAIGWMVWAGEGVPNALIDGGQLGNTFGHADQAALVGVPELLFLHPDGHRPYRREDSQHDAQLQCDQLEP